MHTQFEKPIEQQIRENEREIEIVKENIANVQFSADARRHFKAKLVELEEKRNHFPF